MVQKEQRRRENEREEKVEEKDCTLYKRVRERKDGRERKEGEKLKLGRGQQRRRRKVPFVRTEISIGCDPRRGDLEARRRSPGEGIWARSSIPVAGSKTSIKVWDCDDGVDGRFNWEGPRLIDRSVDAWLPYRPLSPLFLRHADVCSIEHESRCGPSSL